LNILSIIFSIFGSYKKKVEYDLILRPQHAYSLLKISEYAKKHGYKTLTILEFGVASGAGLMNLVEISKKLSKTTGVQFKIYGFDTGKGMPKPESYKDHPEYYKQGDFLMDYESLKQHLPNNVELLIGDVKDTLQTFKSKLTKDEPIGFISFDLDYYCSTKSALHVLRFEPLLYLPLTYIYFDDIAEQHHNSFCGELLAIKEFNVENEFRKLEYHRFLENERIFRRCKWIKQIYYFHVLDHPIRNDLSPINCKKTLENPYLR
jgi:hypothetical protein